MLFFGISQQSTAEKTHPRVTIGQQTWKWEIWKLLHTNKFLSKTHYFVHIW